MSFARRDQLLVQYNTRGCTLSDSDKDAYERNLVTLAKVTETFPTAVLHVEIARQVHSGDYEVKLDLALARSLDIFASDIDEHPHPAFRRCVRGLIGRVQAFKDGRTPDARRGRPEAPAQQVRAPVEPELGRLEAAVNEGDYAAFRDTIAVYRDSLRNRIGRRIELQPEAAAQLGDGLSLDECVEEVFLNAFESFDRRPGPPESLGDWLETLIDRSIRALVGSPHADDERANISFVRSARSAGGAQRDGGPPS